jgi:Mg-chelatase subunit ChlD
MDRQTLMVLLSCIIFAICAGCGDETMESLADDGGPGYPDNGDTYPEGNTDISGMLDSFLDDDDGEAVQPEDLEELLDAGEMIPPEMIRPEDSIHLFAQGLPDPGTDQSLNATWRIMQYSGAQGETLVAQLGVKGALNQGEERGSLNAVILLDKSGSMNDEGKIDYAIAAAKNFITQLGPSDTISLFAFSGVVQTIFDGVSGSYARELIGNVNDIEADGLTNIELALQTGFDALATHTSADSADYFLLLTDGVPTAGATEFSSLTNYADSECGSSITVSTIGFGGDADETLMQNIAENCGGRYNFAENTADLQEVFIEEAQAAILAAAENVVVNLLADDNLPRFSQIGYRSYQVSDNLLTVGLGNIPSLAERVIIIEWPLFDTAVTSGSISALIDYYETDGDVLQRTDSAVALVASSMTADEQAMLMRNVALGHMLTFFIDLGERVINLGQDPTTDDLLTMQKINTEMQNALDAGSNSSNNTFSDFAELGQMYERLLIDAL